jgi:hypothetical protein
MKSGRETPLRYPQVIILVGFGFAAGCEAVAPPRRAGRYLNRAAHAGQALIPGVSGVALAMNKSVTAGHSHRPHPAAKPKRKLTHNREPL